MAHMTSSIDIMTRFGNGCRDDILVKGNGGCFEWWGELLPRDAKLHQARGCNRHLAEVSSILASQI